MLMVVSFKSPICNRYDFFVVEVVSFKIPNLDKIYQLTTFLFIF